MTSNIDKAQQFVGIIEPCIKRHHTALVVQLSLQIEADDMMTFCHRCSCHKLVLVSEYFYSSIAFTIVLLPAFEHTK